MEIKIEDVYSHIVYDSRGRPTLEVTLVSSNGFKGSYASPSGASVGKYESPSFPRGGISDAKKLVESSIKRVLKGFKFSTQDEIDNFIFRYDGTGKYEKIGSTVSLGISFAAAELGGLENGIPIFKWLKRLDKPLFPRPLCNIIGGGKHALNRSIDIQEILVYPVNVSTYREAYQSCVTLHREVAKILMERDTFFNGGRNDEGAWVTSLQDDEAFHSVEEAIDRVRSEIGVKFALGVDMAASSLWDPENKLYVYRRSGLSLDREEQINYVLDLIDKYKLKYVEDPLHEDDFPGFALLTKSVGRDVIICGDDLYVTNVSRIKLGVSEKAGNAVIIKPNQVGDVTRSLEASSEASRNGFKIVVSHRSGETPYPHISHLALAVQADLFKVSPVYGERVVKHNELLKLEDLYGGRGLKPI